MRTIYFGFVAAALSAGTAATVGIAHAEYLDSKQVGAATVSIGAGAAWLTLPDVKFVKVLNAAGSSVIGAIDNSKDFGANAGLNINGEISFPVPGVLGNNQNLSVKGFWTRIEDKDTSQCTFVFAATSCALFALTDPNANGQSLVSPVGILTDRTFSVSSERTVNHWGAALESRWLLMRSAFGSAPASPHNYIALGVDIRGIDQDLNLRITSAPLGELGTVTYDETLSTRYYGAYAAFGTEINPFPVSWGVQVLAAIRGGLYAARTHYSGVIADPFTANTIAGALSLSKSRAAFIGGVALEARKQLGDRAALSVKNEFEYYSWVPEMNYNDNDVAAVPRSGPNVGTSIGNASAFSFRSMVQLTIALGGPATR